MRNPYFLLISLLFWFDLQSQTIHRCGTMEHFEAMKAQDPLLEKKISEKRAFLNQSQKNFRSARKQSGGVDTIPVVIHVVWNKAVQNISYAQIFSQMDALNADYQRMNADTIKTPLPFLSYAGRLPLYFKLAQTDPDGNPSSGIVRIQTHHSSFENFSDDIKYTKRGGHDAWDPSRYLNIWVSYLSSGLLGYSVFPDAGSPDSWGAAINYTAFGTIGTVAAPFDKGRTLTHELGHCFSLLHVWGDDNGACSGTDQISDTPNQSDASYGKLTFPRFDACSPSGNGIMFMNFMDYTDDVCMNMFTKEQADRMIKTVNQYYFPLLNDSVLYPPVQKSNSARLSKILTPASLSCSNSFRPSVLLKNTGKDTLHSLQFHYTIDGNSFNYDWNGSVPANKDQTISLPLMNVNGGLHLLKIYSNHPNGISDTVAARDTLLYNFTVDSVASALSLPYAESFERGIPSNISIVNPDHSIGWALANYAASDSSNCIYLNSYNYSDKGQVDEYRLPALDLSKGQPKLTFFLAYKMFDDPSLNPVTDTLSILLSSDCGNSFTEIFKKYALELVTSSSVTSTFEFRPEGNEWRQFVVDLSPYSSSTHAILAFRNISGFQNQMYIDQIMVGNTPLAISQPRVIENPGLFPNPASKAVNLSYTLLAETSIGIEVYDITGRCLQSLRGQRSFGKHTETLNAQGSLLPGIYFVKIFANNEASTLKLIISE